MKNLRNFFPLSSKYLSVRGVTDQFISSKIPGTSVKALFSAFPIFSFVLCHFTVSALFFEVERISRRHNLRAACLLEPMKEVVLQVVSQWQFRFSINVVFSSLQLCCTYKANTSANAHQNRRIYYAEKFSTLKCLNLTTHFIDRVYEGIWRVH